MVLSGGELARIEGCAQFPLFGTLGLIMMIFLAVMCLGVGCFVGHRLTTMINNAGARPAGPSPCDVVEPKAKKSKKQRNTRTVSTQSQTYYARHHEQPRFLLTPKGAEGCWSMDEKLD